MDPLSPDIMSALRDAESIFWAGEKPATFKAVCSDSLYRPGGDYRADPSLHQSFDLVFLVERDLGRLKAWPLVLDEAFRLLRPGGLAVVRFSQTRLLSVFEFAGFCERWHGGQTLELVHQSQAGEVLTFALRLRTGERRPSGLDSIGFGVITDGRKPQNVRAFVESVAALRGLEAIRWKVLVCGPRSVLDHLGPLSAHVLLVDEPTRHAGQPWITRKKNLIVEAADAHGLETVVVVHDRYAVRRDLLARLAEFGGDFDVLVPAQTTEDGQRIPDWVAMAAPGRWTPPGWLDYGDYHPNVYVNGGAVIAKTRVLLRTPWSELLFWGQAEDLELTARLAEAGAVPRLARDVTLVTAEMRPDFVNCFVRIPWREDAYAAGQADADGTVSWAGLSVYRPGTWIDLSGENAIGRAAELGVVLDHRWRPVPGGLRWEEADEPFVSFLLPGNGAGDVLTFAGVGAADIAIEAVAINAQIACPPGRRNRGSRLSFVQPDRTLSPNGVLHVSLIRMRGRALSLAGLSLGPPENPVGPEGRAERVGA